MKFLFWFFASFVANAAPVQLNMDASNNPEYGVLFPLASQWGGSSFGIPLPSDADNASTPNDQARLAALEKTATDFLSRGKRITVRLNGHPSMSHPTWLALAGGETIDSKYYPPPGPDKRVWKRIGYWHGRYIQTLLNICDRLGVSRSNITVELSNEVGIGGVTGPYRGSWSSTKNQILAAYDLYEQCPVGSSCYSTFKTEWLKVMPEWTLVNGVPMPGGTIPQRYFDQMITQRQQYSVMNTGIRVVGATFEASGIVDADLTYKGDIYYELESWKSSLAQQYRALFNQINLNFYAPSARNQYVKHLDGTWIRRDLTPAEAIDVYKLKLERRRAIIASHPVLQGLPIGITETNFMLSAIPGASTTEQENNSPLYRQALVDAIPSLSGIVEAGVFCAVSKDNASTGTELYKYNASTNTLAVVGGVEVYPHSSSNAVDTVPPSVAIANPTAGSTVNGTLAITVNASDNVKVDTVRFFVDGVALATEEHDAPYNFSVDTTALSNGSHSLRAQAVDTSGNVADSASITVQVSNVDPNADTTLPSIVINSPSNGATVITKQSYAISVSASDNVGIAKVEILVDGIIKCTSASASYSCSWRVPNQAGRVYTITSRAYDTSGNHKISAPVEVYSVAGGGNSRSSTK